MIRSIFASRFKNKLSKWWNEKKEKIKEDFEQSESDFIGECILKKKNIMARHGDLVRDVEILLENVEHKKKEKGGFARWMTMTNA